MRSRWIRIPLGIVAVLVVAIVAVRMFVPAEKWMRLAFDQVHKQTGLVANATEAEVSFPWPVGLRLKSFTLSGPEGATDGSRVECAADEVVVVADLGSILRGKPNVSEVRLVRPDAEVWLPRASEGEPGTGASGNGGSSSGPVAALGLVSIEDGHLVLHDPNGIRIEFTGLQNKASVDLESSRFAAQLEGSWERFEVAGDSIPRPVTLPQLTWDADLEGPIDAQQLDFDFRSLTLPGLKGTGPARLDLSGPEPTLDARLELAGEIEPLYRELGRAFVAAPGVLPPPWRVEDLSLLDGRVEGEATWAGPLPGSDPLSPLNHLLAQFDLKGLEFQLLGRDEWPRVDAKLRMAEGKLFVEDIRGAGELGLLSGVFSLPLGQDGALAGDLGLDVRARVLRELAEDAWPRLRELAGPDAAGPETWPGIDGTIRGRLALDLPLASSEATEELDPESLRWTNEAWKLSMLLPSLTDSIRIEGGNFETTLASATVEGVSVSGPGFTTLVRGTADGWPETTRLRGRLDMDRFDLDAYQAAIVGAGGEEQASADGIGRWFGPRPAYAQAPQTTNLPAPPENLEFDLDVSARTVVASGYTLQDVAGKAELLAQRMKIPRLDGSLGSGRIDGRGEVDWTVDPPRWRGDAVADSIPAAALLEPFAPGLASALTTTLSGNIDLGGPLVGETEAIVQALTGLAELRAGEGKLTTEAVLGSKVSEFLGDRADGWRDLDFRSLVADVKLEDGAVVFERMTVSGETGVAVSGRIGLDGRADYRLDVLLPPGVTPELGALAPLADILRDRDGRIGFGAIVSGPVARPKVQIDFAQLEEKAKAKGEDRVRSLLEEGLGDLRDLGNSALGDSSATLDPDDLGKKAEDAAKDLLRRFGGGKKKGGGGR